MAGLSEAVIFLWLFHCALAQRMLYISGTTAGTNNTCGGSFTLAPRSTENVTLLVSKDRLPRGYCEVTVGINNSQRCRRQICVQGAGTLENTGMIFKFTPSPSGQPDEYRGPYTNLTSGKCFDAYSLFVNISEPESVGNNFDFQLTFRPTCNDSNSASDIASSDADSQALNTKEELEKAVILTTVYGAITGVCLAFCFLIILFITYCYYKSYPYGNKKREPVQKKQAPASSDKKDINKERNMEEMKLLGPAEPVGDSSGLGVSDGDVVDLEEGSISKKGEPDSGEEEKQESVTVEKETTQENVEKSEGNVEEKKGNDYVDVDLKTPEAEKSLQAASLDSD